MKMTLLVIVLVLTIFGGTSFGQSDQGLTFSGETPWPRTGSSTGDAYLPDAYIKGRSGTNNINIPLPRFIFAAKDGIRICVSLLFFRFFYLFLLLVQGLRLVSEITRRDTHFGVLVIGWVWYVNRSDLSQAKGTLTLKEGPSLSSSFFGARFSHTHSLSLFAR
jgi:hypothetical protein